MVCLYMEIQSCETNGDCYEKCFKENIIGNSRCVTRYFLEVIVFLLSLMCAIPENLPGTKDYEEDMFL